VKLWEARERAARGDAVDPSTRWILWSRDGESRLNPKERPGAVPVPGRNVPGDPAVPVQAYRGGPEPVRTRDWQPLSVLSEENARLVHEIVDERRVSPVFQPIIDVERDEVVAFEALARGPEGPLRSPGRLFSAARAIGRAGELDWVVRAQAFRALMDADIHPSVSLFVNIAPDSLIDPCPEDLLPTVWEAETRLRVFVDVDGKAALRHPRAVLESVRRARAAGWGVALDDLGYSASSQTFLPVLEPDVVRLDHGLLSAGVAIGDATLTSALAEAERGGASLLVGNVETADTRGEARSIGAAYQQGRFLGVESPILPAVPEPVAAIPMLSRTVAPGRTPWDLLAERGARTMLDLPWDAARNTASQLLGELARRPVRPVLGLLLPHGLELSRDARAIQRVLLENSPLAVMMGQDVSGFDDWRTRAADIPAGHALADHGAIVALSGNMQLAVAFQRADSDRSAGGGRWNLAITQEHQTCRLLMRELLHHADRLSGGVVASLEAPVRGPAG
jgi:EAL domain-containing protein (putative c-di-GMP-specific phosphodiesterase class I)